MKWRAANFIRGCFFYVCVFFFSWQLFPPDKFNFLRIFCAGWLFFIVCPFLLNLGKFFLNSNGNPFLDERTKERFSVWEDLGLLFSRDSDLGLKQDSRKFSPYRAPDSWFSPPLRLDLLVLAAVFAELRRSLQLRLSQSNISFSWAAIGTWVWSKIPENSVPNKSPKSWPSLSSGWI